MIAEIWKDLRDLAQLEEEDVEQWHGLCLSAQNALLSRLRPGVEPKKHGAALARAAAGMAFLEWTRILIARGEAGSFEAGDLRLSQDPASRVEAAKAIQKSRLEEISFLLQDEGFVFRGVKGHG